MTGNTLGERRYYKYTSDQAKIYSYITDKDLGDSISAVLDDTSPPFPRRFKPRGVYVQAEVGGRLVRKFLIVGDKNADVWADTSKTVTIDGQAFKSTGRRGEALSFGANPAAPAAPAP